MFIRYGAIGALSVLRAGRLGGVGMEPICSCNRFEFFSFSAAQPQRETGYSLKHSGWEGGEQGIVQMTQGAGG